MAADFCRDDGDMANDWYSRPSPHARHNRYSLTCLLWAADRTGYESLTCDSAIRLH